MAVGVDLANKQVIFRLYPETTVSASDWNSSTGFTFNSMYHISYAIRYRTKGTSSSTYNFGGMYNFSLSGASITGIVIEMMPGHYKPYYNSGTRNYLYFYNALGGSTTDICITGDQWLIIRSQDSNDKALFTQQMTIQEAIELSSSEGSSAYDTVWDGASEGSTLTAMRVAISGCYVTTSDSGSVWVNNPDKYLGCPWGYNYGTTQLDALTGSLNSEYSILRFGPVYQGSSGWCMPAIYCENGELANSNPDIPAVVKLYDIIRWMKKDLPSTANYEILWVSPTDLDTSTTSQMCTSLNPYREYINGEPYDDLGYWEPRGNSTDYPTTLSAYAINYPGMVNYTGSAGLVVINKYRDINARIPERGQYLKVRNSQLSNVLNTLTASMISSSGINFSDSHDIMGIQISAQNGNLPLKLKVENVDWKYLGQHCFDAKHTQNSAASGVYWSSPSVSGIWWFSTPTDRLKSSTGVVNGLTGWPRQYESYTHTQQKCLYSLNTQRIELNGCNMQSILGHGLHNQNIETSTYMINGTLTAYQKSKVENCKFEDISQKPLQSLLTNPATGPYASTRYYEYPISGDWIVNNEFRRCGSHINLISLGPNCTISGNVIDRMNYLVPGYNKFGIRTYYSHPQHVTKFIDNTLINNMWNFQSCNLLMTGNIQNYEIHPDVLEFYGGGWGGSFHQDAVHNQVSLNVWDNKFMNCKVDGILFEGASPFTPAYSCSATTSGNLANKMDNISFTGNLITKREYFVRLIEENASYNGRTKFDSKTPPSYPLMWISDIFNIDISNNVFLGTEMTDETKYLTTSWGEVLTAWRSNTFNMDSASGVHIHNNKFGNLTGKLFSLTRGSGLNDFTAILDGGPWRTFGQINDFNFYNNKIYNSNNGLMSIEINPHMIMPIDTTVDTNFFVLNYTTIPTSFTASLSAIGMHDDNLSISGAGDGYSYHQGKSKKWKIYDNEFIQDYNSDFFTYFGIKNQGYETAEISAEWAVPKGIAIFYNSNMYKWSYNGVSYIPQMDPQVRPDIYASITPFNDDDSTISGNTFYGWDQSTRNIEWISYKTNEESANYINSNYATSPIGSTGIIDVVTKYSVSSVNFITWKNLNLSMSSNWWYHAQNIKNEEYPQGFVTKLSRYVLTGGVTWSNLGFVPYMANIRQDSYDDAMFNLSGWTNYLNTATTGWRGTNNSVSTSIPNLNYTFDINNPNSFLEPISASSTRTIKTGKKRNSNISGGYCSFPNQFKQNVGQLSELQEILDYHVNADTRGRYIETRKQIKHWISRHVDETVFEKQDTFYFLDLVKKIEISKITNNTYWAEQSFEKYIKVLAPNSDIHKNIKLNFIKKEEK